MPETPTKAPELPPMNERLADLSVFIRDRLMPLYNIAAGQVLFESSATDMSTVICLMSGKDATGTPRGVRCELSESQDRGEMMLAAREALMGFKDAEPITNDTRKNWS